MKSVVLVALLGALAAASPSSSYVVHEKRSEQREWTRLGRAPSDKMLQMRIGLQQNNLDKGPQWLDEVSNPASSKFGQHWAVEDIINAFRPSDETIDGVRNWLTEAGIADHKVALGLHWVNFNATVKQAEELLKTEYSIFQHDTGDLHLACDSYSLPEHVAPKVDLIMPTVHFDRKLRSKSEEKIDKRSITANVKPGTARGVGSPYNGFVPKIIPTNSNFKQIWTQLENCNNTIVPNCLRALYLFPPGLSKHPKNSFGIVEYTPQAYIGSDLDIFFKNFTPKAVGTRPIFNSIDGGVVQNELTGFNYNGESNLDLEYGMALVYPQNVTLYQVGDEVEGASFNDFLDGIDASYCTYLGGDDPEQDATYPDPYEGGYKGPKDCGKYAPTKVISTSYGYNEADLTPFYEARQCNEYLKLGLAGVSVLYSSGDYGVAGNGGQCIDPTTGQYNNGASGRFNPSFPATCPYITAVGATEVKKNVNVVQALARGQQPERACETVIYSGGGFSNNFAIPSYQSAAVASYFKNFKPIYSATQYNNSQTSRGFPDIAANGANYLVTVTGKYAKVYGTSASSPTLGSILTLINEARLALGKGPIGFVNPVAYAHPQAFNDIVEGGNQGCGTAGFSAVKGWDPVTGLGTPNFPKLLSVYLKLP